MGMSPRHATSVPLILNLDTGAITAQYHVVFDDWFNTVTSDCNELPDFQHESWRNMFSDSSHQYHGDGGSDDEMDPEDGALDVPSTEMSKARRSSDHFDMNAPPIQLPVQNHPTHLPPPIRIPYPSSSSLPQQSSNFEPTSQDHEPSPFPLLAPDTINPDVKGLSKDPSHEQNSDKVHSNEVTKKEQVSPTQPHRSTRIKRSPIRLTINDNLNKKSYANVSYHDGIPNHEGVGTIVNTYLDQLQDLHSPTSQVFKANSSKSNPDIFTFDEAMNDIERSEEWKAAMRKEIEELESHQVWDVIDISQPRNQDLQVVPSTWTLRVKQAPDGSIRKLKARFCMRGDLQETSESSYSPVASLCTVRLFLIITLALGWDHRAIDFSNAFVQAKLEEPVYMHLPRGFSTPVQDGQKYCLKLKRSLYA